MSATVLEIAALRAFNRFYTPIIGLLEESMLHSPFSLPEARVVYEVWRRRTVAPGVLAGDLGMDRGQMSRLVWKLSDREILAILPHEGDGRSNNLSLTAAGEKAARELDDLSDRAAAALLDPLPAGDRARLVESMETIVGILGQPERPKGPVVLRPHRIGELGWLVHRQGLLYHREFGWNGEFESLISRIYGEFETASDEPGKALWVAEQDGAIVGSVFIVPGREAGVAQLRMLYVEPEARGQGIGQKLVDEAVRFSREAGYGRIILWTQNVLTSARRIYDAAGFRLVSEEAHHAFGKDLVGQYLGLDLVQ